MRFKTLPYPEKLILLRDREKPLVACVAFHSKQHFCRQKLHIKLFLCKTEFFPVLNFPYNKWVKKTFFNFILILDNVSFDTHINMYEDRKTKFYQISKIINHKTFNLMIYCQSLSRDLIILNIF